MRFGRVAVSMFAASAVYWLFAVAQADGQQSPSPVEATATVPQLIRIAGSARDVTGQPLTGSMGITFSLYKDQTDQVAIWQEIQNVQLDSAGHYSVLLGATNEEGLPLEIFSSGEARWLSVHPDGQSEQPRILLLSVAYALKAADSDMLGGRPASAFALAGSLGSSSQQALGAPVESAKLQIGSQVVTSGSGAPPLLLPPPATCSSITSDGNATANQLAKFTTACNIENSAIFESGGNVGIGNTSPAGMLDVSGTAFIRGTLSSLGGTIMLPTGTSTATAGFISNPLDLAASVFNTSLSKPVNYVFRWQSEPSGNNSTNTGATLNLLYGVTGDIAETGLSINKNGIFTFAPGQTFPGLGTVTSVATGTGLTGGPITNSGTISIATGGVTNALLANPSVTVKAGSGLSGGGTVALGDTITLTNSAPSSGGTVTSVATGIGLTGGPITTSGTISIPAGGVTNTLLANPSVTVKTGTGLSGGGTVALGGTITLTNSAPSSGGTVTSVATGAGLTGGPITASGTISIPVGGVTNTLLANPSITITPGSGLSGGGTVALGGTVTLTNSAPSLGGTVTSVTAGTGLTGGPIITSGSLSLNTAYTDGRYLKLTGGVLSGGLTGTTAAFTGGLAASTGTFTGAVTAAGAVMPAKGTATATLDFPSNPVDLFASSFSSSTSKAVSQDFRWQAQPTGNDSSNPSASLNLLFGSNGTLPVETGFSFASNGRITFAPGQTFPGTGTITQVTAGAGLAGGGTTGNVSLSLLRTCSAGQTLLWNGGTWICGSFGSVSGTTDGIAFFSSPVNVTSTPAPTDGQILIGATGSAPALGTLTAGPNITITNGPGSVEISAADAAALPFFATGGGRTDTSVSAGQNVTVLWGFLLPYSVTTTNITYDVTTADNTANKYDIGIFTSAGDLVLNVGPTPGTSFAPSAAFGSLAWTQGSTNLAAGRYYLAFTTNCSSSCTAIGAAANYVSFAVNTSAGASTGGALPSTVTPPADVWNTGGQPTIVIR